MKTLAVLTLLLSLLVACGGGADPATTKDTRTGANGNSKVFDTPPAPGRNP